MAGESTRIMVNPTQDSQSLTWSMSFPLASPMEAWSPEGQEGGHGWMTDLMMSWLSYH